MQGVTQAQVLSAVDALTSRGERATVRAVRAELGTGSLGTIHRFMSARQPVDSGPTALSPELLRALADELQRSTAMAVADLREQLQVAAADRDALALDAEKLAEQLHVALEAKEAAERDLAVTKAMLSGVQSRLDDAHALLSRAAVAPAKPAPRPSRKKPVA